MGRSGEVVLCMLKGLCRSRCRLVIPARSMNRCTAQSLMGLERVAGHVVGCYFYTAGCVSGAELLWRRCLLDGSFARVLITSQRPPCFRVLSSRP